MAQVPLATTACARNYPAAARSARGAACKFAEGDLGGFIEPHTPWDLGHPDGESSGGPEHSGCTRSAPARLRTKWV